MRVYLKSGEELLFGDYFTEGKNSFLVINGLKKQVFFRSIAGKDFYSFDQKSWNLLVSNNNGSKFVFKNKDLSVHKGFLPSGGNEDGLGSLITQMPGKVVKLLVETDQKVKKGETLLILEAMKMENEIKSGADATVKAIHVAAGDNIEAGHLMIELSDQD